MQSAEQGAMLMSGLTFFGTDPFQKVVRKELQRQ